MKELTIANLIRGVEKRQFLLPTIQRGFVWEAKKIETLFDSLLRGFPISSFLFWEVPEEDEHTLNLLKINADSDVGDDDAGLDNVYEFKFLTEDDAKKCDDETSWFEVGKILTFKGNDIASFLMKHKKLVDENTNVYKALPYDILYYLWEFINTKPVIEYHLESSKSLDEVLNIFVRINNGGKPVDLSELLISLITAQLKDFDVENSNDKNSIKFKIENFKPQRMKKMRDEWDKMATAIKSAVTLNGIFSSGTDATLIKFRKSINDSHESFPIFEMLDANDKSADEISDELINALMNITYKYKKNVLMALTILYNGKVDLATVDVDHMFPKVKIKNLGELAQQGITDEAKFQTDYEKFCSRHRFSTCHL